MALTKGQSVTMPKGRFQIQMHILHQRPSCRLVDFTQVNGTSPVGDEEIVLRPGHMARATFRIMNGHYYLRPCMRVVLRDGGIRGVGWIVETS